MRRVARHTRSLFTPAPATKVNDAEMKKTLWRQSTPHRISNRCKNMFNVHTHFSILFAIHVVLGVYLWRVQWHVREVYRKKRDFSILQEDRTEAMCWSMRNTSHKNIHIFNEVPAIEMFFGIDVNRTESCQKSTRMNFTRRNVFHFI